MTKKHNFLIEIENLSKSFKDKKVLDSISFELFEGEILGIVGFSGQGKSTLLNLICGLEKKDEGKIKFNSHSFGSAFVKERKNLLGYSSQNHSFYDELSLKDNLEYFGTLYNIEIEKLNQRIKDLLKKFELERVGNNLSISLSEGQKKRLDLACSLIHSPKILILDEPTANLDFKLRDELLDYIKEINKDGVSVIFVSHNLEEVEKICNRVLMLNNSKIDIIENPKQVQSHFKRFIKNG